MPLPISLRQRRRRPAVFALRPARRRTKTHGEVAPSRGVAQHWSPRAIRPVIMGHALSLHSTGLICKSFSVITVCNPALMRIFQGEPRNLRAHASLILDAGHSDTYKYPRTVPLRGQINRAFAISNLNPVYVVFTPPLGQLARESKFQQHSIQAGGAPHRASPRSGSGRVGQAKSWRRRRQRCGAGESKCKGARRARRQKGAASGENVKA
jgi:hypothetical protein